jgi:hypothetical protein
MSEKPLRVRKGQNIKNVDGKRAKALENLAKGRAKRQEMLKKKREAEENPDYESDLDSDSSEEDEEVQMKDFILSKKPLKKKKKSAHTESQPDNTRELKEDIGRIKEAIIKLAEEQKKKPKSKGRTKLVMLPQQQPPTPQEKPRKVNAEYEALRNRIIGSR